MTTGPAQGALPGDEPGVRIVSRMLGFLRLLRENGFLVGVREVLDLLKLASDGDVLDANRVRSQAKALLCSDRRDWASFDTLFDAYWRSTNRRGTVSAVGAAGSALPPLESDGRAPSGSVAEAERATGNAAGAAPEGTLGGASALQARLRADFGFITDEEAMRETEELVERLARRMRRHLSRRLRSDSCGRRIHLRRTLRKSLRYGGLPLELAYRRRRQDLPRLVLILDVSRSMSLYSLLLLRFMRGLVGVFRDAEAFAFHTRLVHVTEALRHSELARVREKLAVLSLGWSGGTRIGESLQAFERDYAGRLLGGRTVVVIMSDGFDTGEPARLAEVLERIRARASRLVWLNPLLGREGYEPLAGGMQVALPLVDRFLPAHNLASLQALEREFALL